MACIIKPQLLLAMHTHTQNIHFQFCSIHFHVWFISSFSIGFQCQQCNTGKYHEKLNKKSVKFRYKILLVGYLYYECMPYAFFSPNCQNQCLYFVVVEKRNQKISSNSSDLSELITCFWQRHCLSTWYISPRNQFFLFFYRKFTFYSGNNSKCHRVIQLGCVEKIKNCLPKYMSIEADAWRNKNHFNRLFYETMTEISVNILLIVCKLVTTTRKKNAICDK